MRVAGHHHASALAGSRLLLALAISVVPVVASAQSFTGGAISRPLMLPDSARVAPREAAVPRGAAGPREAAAPLDPAALDPAASRESAVGAAPAREPDSAAKPLLQRLPARSEGWRIEGEGGQLNRPLYVPPGRERGEFRLRVAYRTDISVLPAASPLTVLINGRTIGIVREPASVEHVVDFPIPAGALVSGYNAVSITTEHRHRVDCSSAASFELWTEINPALTGLLYAADARSDVGPDDLLALPLRPDGALHLRVVAGGKLGPRDVERALRVVQAVALASGTEFPVVDYGPALAEDGLNIRLGGAEQPSAAGPSGVIAREIGTGLALQKVKGQTALTLVVSAEAQDAALALPRAKAIGSPQGVKLAGRVTSIAGSGGSLPLNGSQPILFEEGRRAVALPLTLPADFFPADYDRAVLRLSGEWAPGRKGARGDLVIKVNGRDVASWPLPAAAGAFNRHPIHLPLRFFRPGSNRVELEAVLRTDVERGCGADRRGTARLRLAPDSELAFPRLAQVGRFPDLAQLAAGRAATGPVRVIVPRPDRDNMAAAATIVTRLAVAGGRAVPLNFSLDGTPTPGEDALIVADAATTRAELLDVVRLDPDRVVATWMAEGRDRSALGQAASGPLWRRAPGCAFGSVASPDGAWTSAAPAVETTGSIDLRPSLDAFERPLAALRSLQTTVLDQLGRAATPAAPAEGEIAVLSQGRDEAGSRVTLLTGQVGSLRDAAVCLSTPAVWNNLAGRSSFLQDGADTLRPITATNPDLFATQPASIGNLRLVAAGWLSTHSVVVGFATLLVLLLVTGSTSHLLKRVGRVKA